MLNKQKLAAIITVLPGKLNYCQSLVKNKQCDWDCCIYQDSYCLLFPGEYESAVALGYHFLGYDIIDDNYFGGMKVVPKSKACCVDKKLGANAYKSIDCKLYPLWPEVQSNQLVLIAGDLCPIIKAGLPLGEHARAVTETAEILLQDDDIRGFLAEARMVAYSNYTNIGVGG